MDADRQTASPAVARMDLLLAGRYRIVAYRDLPIEHQLALAYWMCIDGEAWDPRFTPEQKKTIGAAYVHARAGTDTVKAALQQRLPDLVRRYGKTLFGVAQLPTEDVVAAVRQDAEFEGEFGTPESVDQHALERRWPVILSDDPELTLEDGWHRLGCYVHRGDATIPAVFFARDRHLAAQSGRA